MNDTDRLLQARCLISSLTDRAEPGLEHIDTQIDQRRMDASQRLYDTLAAVLGIVDRLQAQLRSEELRSMGYNTQLISLGRELEGARRLVKGTQDELAYLRSLTAGLPGHGP